MPIPHDKCPPRVAQTGLLLLVMQYRVFAHPKLASQVPTFQTQATFLHLIDVQAEQMSLPAQRKFLR